MNFLSPAPGTFATRGGTFTADINGVIANVTNVQAMIDLLASGCTPIVNTPFVNFRNMLLGGSFSTNPFQRNIPGLASAGVIAAAITNTVTYFADRFFAVGGASSSILMSLIADTAIAGFSQSLKVSRSVGNANLAVINFGQVLETIDSFRAQTQLVTLSFWAKAGANFSAAGALLAVQLISGTGSNQSAANMVAGSWTGQANAINATQALTTGMVRYSFTGIVPVGATQLGMLLSFTPVGTAGADDSFSIQGAQLEVGGLTPFEHRPAAVELELCQRYAFVVPEPANGNVVAVGSVTGANAETFVLPLPVPMRVAPTVTATVGTFKNNSATGGVVAATGLAGSTSSVNAAIVTATGTGTAGQAALLQGGGGTGSIVASAEF